MNNNNINSYNNIKSYNKFKDKIDNLKTDYLYSTYKNDVSNTKYILNEKEYDKLLNYNYYSNLTSS